MRPRKNSRHTNSARRIETGRLEALEIPQIPRKIDFELVFWAGSGPGPAGPGLGPTAAAFGRGRELLLRGTYGENFFEKMTMKK